MKLNLFCEYFILKIVIEPCEFNLIKGTAMEALVEQRSCNRISVNIPVKLIYSVDKYFLAQIISMNESGFLCLLKKSIPVQSKIRITILLPAGNTNDGSRPLKCSGVVVREHLFEQVPETCHSVAVKFSEMPVEDMTRLKQFIIDFYSV